MSRSDAFQISSDFETFQRRLQALAAAVCGLSDGAGGVNYHDGVKDLAMDIAHEGSQIGARLDKLWITIKEPGN